ncbi:hypothetical protein SDRG_10133 [Saprolegnia diclina VS20]|uniref:TFIIS N-terminal domain-containing protein n=1 Tax=Saprolegnia diclina (strain VS20) TaxID=1156394 RepID=T0RJ45_SAPDV|nr:hypothetical protein SDRG_10133 [Saprolegnia diclina VS20]EQC32388.1 hypothetical protein SDRG_10133 [Saprolegnia diclina VS20]|eukprot:XP_008614329.1 hypothetical protein SDRG_10133 [Saprolegnia diclina VS20]
MSAWSFDEVSSVSKKLHATLQQDGWRDDVKNTKELLGMLSNLQSYRPDHESLAKTKLGVAVNKLRKHTDKCVSGYAGVLTNRWKEALDVKPSAPSKPRAANELADSTKAMDADQKEMARNRLANSYAKEKAKRDARTSIYLDQPVTKTKRGKAPKPTSIITRFTTPQRAQAKIVRSMAPTSSSARSTASSTLSRSTMASRPSSAPTSRALPRTALASKNMTDEERHQMRQQRLRAIAEEKARQMGKAVPPALRDANARERPRDSGSKEKAPYVDARKMYTRLPEPSSNKQPAAGSSKPAAGRPLPPKNRPNAPEMTKEQADRKAFLDKMYPRVASTAPENPLKRKRETDPASSARDTKQPWTEGEREVVHWLKGMTDDMSQYSQAFFDNGFDSMKAIAMLTEDDLASMVPKKGHCRLIALALESLQRKSKKRVETKKRPKRAYEEDDDMYESDDGFVVSDEEEDVYVPGAITSLMRKGRRPRKYSLDDGADSSDMEATFDDIEREEARSRRYGDYEDEIEDRRNRLHKQKKDKKKKRSTSP